MMLTTDVVMGFTKSFLDLLKKSLKNNNEEINIKQKKLISIISKLAL